MKTCSKENGARLQELGVTVPSYFYHYNGVLLDSKHYFVSGCIQAWTAGELLEILKLIDRKVCIHNAIEGWLCGANLEDTLAERVIYLIEHDHITVGEINENATL